MLGKKYFCLNYNYIKITIRTQNMFYDPALIKEMDYPKSYTVAYAKMPGKISRPPQIYDP